MGSTHLFLYSSSPIINFPPFNPRIPSLNPNFQPQFRSSSTSTPKRSTNPDAFRGDRFDFRRDKRRNWWSDDDDDSDDEDDDEFGFWEEPNPIDWVSKVFSIFGWMVPAVIISTLLGGTGTNSFIMALVLPFGQTALSLVIDRVTGSPSSRSNSSPRYKSRSRRSPRSRNRSSVDNPFVGTSPGRGGYQTWRTTNNSSVKKCGENGSRFGGWDELDEQVRTTSSFSRKGQSQEVNVLQRQDISPGKLSRRRNPEKPLFMRLLIAVFPLLGSWTRFFI